MNREQTIEEIVRGFMAIKRKLVENHTHKHHWPVTASQMQVLFVVKHHAGIGLKEVAEQLGISSSAVNQLIDGLVENDFLIRENDEIDRRALKLKLSPKTKKIFNKLMTQRLKEISLLFEIFTDTELEQLRNLNQKITAKILETRE